MNSFNGDQASSYLVTKHSWKGKYRRVLTLSQDGFSTYNPSSMEVTNTWKIGDIVGLTPTPSSAGGPPQTPGAALEFQLVFRKGKKTDNMRFSSEWRSTILTEALRLIQKSGNETGSSKVKFSPTNCTL
jgi:DnaJ family protein C protein 13